jgi:UTP--glucose-1-phosphate uridylyltransferase
MHIAKAIILAAGYGTRFLPATKAMPKEMLPVVDKPVIQYVVEDAVAAGVKDIIIVTNAQKRAIEDHFDHSFQLENLLEKSGKEDLLNEVRSISELGNFIYVRQKGAKGTLDGFKCGFKAIGDEPFLALWGDDFFLASPTRSQQLIAAFNTYQAPVLGAMETHNPEHGERYGFVTGQEVEPGIIKIDKIIEKPGHGKAPSPYAVVSGFVLTPQVMAYGEKVEPAPSGEYLYIDAIALMLQEGLPVYAAKIQNGTYYDCGNKLEYIKTNIELALANSQMGGELKQYIDSIK